MKDWRQELSSIVEGKTRMTRAEKENAAFENFLNSVAVPALRQLAEELCKLGRETTVRDAPASAILTVNNGAIAEVIFRVVKRHVPTGILPHAEVRLTKGQRFVNYDSSLIDDNSSHSLEDVTQEDIINCFIKFYRTISNGDQAGN